MTKRVYLHVGAPKSGTTYLQRVLEANRQLLAAAGVLLVGDRHLDRIHAALAGARGQAARRPARSRARTPGPRSCARSASGRATSAVLSYELFAAASAGAGRSARWPTSRRTTCTSSSPRATSAESVVSAWQERLKFGLTTPLEKWTPKPESAEGSEWGWRTLDPAGRRRALGVDASRPTTCTS